MEGEGYRARGYISMSLPPLLLRPPTTPKQNLFDEYKYFMRYPEKELRLTARLFGLLVQVCVNLRICVGVFQNLHAFFLANLSS